MSVVKRFNELLDLDEIDVLIDEVDKSRHIILSDIPDSLPQGRSSFLIETSPYMKQNTELQIDFIDSEGASIYTEPIADYLEGRARRVSVEVYDDTAPGIATLIIVGELIAVPDGNTIFSDAEQVPPRFQNAYNVRLTKQIVINPTAVNTQPIKFFGQPIINVTETRVGTMVRSEVTGSITSPLFELEAVPTDENLLFKPYGVNLNPSQGLLSEGAPSSPAKQRSLKAYIESRKRKNRKGKRKNSIFKRSGLLSKTNSPPTFPYRIRPGSFNGEESFRFDTGFVGGEVHFHTSSLGNTFGSSSFYPQAALTEAGLLETPTFDTEKEQGIVNISASMYTASIVDLVSDRIIAVDKPFTNKNVNGEDIILPIYARGQIHYEAMPTASYAAANLVSYANVTLADMRTFSGDVYKVKVYVKSEGGFDDYKLLAEVPLEGKELLVDDASVGQGDRTGYFIEQDDVHNFWTISGSTNGESVLATSASNAAYNNDVMLDSVQLSGSLLQPAEHLKFQLKDEYKFELTKGVDYNLSIDVIGNRSGSDYATLAFYISGSSMNRLDNLFYDEYADVDVEESNKYGKRLGTLTVSSEDDEVKNFQTVAQTFTPDITGDGVLQIRVLQGIWNVGDIAIGPAADTGFNPSLFQFKQEMPSELSHKRPDTFEFMAEFYDVNNNLSDTIAYQSGVQFTGTNMTITGEDNVLESNMFIGGDTTGSGMHLGGVTSTLPETGGAGAEGSGFMRSVGYEGFTSASDASLGGRYGFMIYSGSVLPDSGEDYLGVGLELVGASGSLKFRTNPSVFDVRADSFFVGREHENSATNVGQFMSGSDGNIEISSSLFHLDPINERLIIGAGTTINAELSANTIRTPALIGGNPSTAANASSSIDEHGFAKFASASIAGFVVNTEEIKSDNQNLRLKSSGQITGSTVLFSGGKIANWDITGDKLQSLNDNSKGIFLDADASSPIIEIRENDDNRLQLYHATDTNWGLVGRSGGNVVFRLGDTNQIAGWTINNSTIQGGNLVLGKEGFIKSADYISDISGFIITAAENGYAEFENCKIRGTMATTTFEKESVNAVGGQLFVANSAALSGSNVASTEVSMSLVNVTGFTKGEILLIKKVHDTGFNTEYVQVVSSSRNTDGGDDDPDGLAGELFVKRGYGYYTRNANKYHNTTTVADQKYYNTAAGTDPPNGTVIPGFNPANNDRLDTDFIPFGTSFAGGNVAGQNMIGSHVHSGSFHLHITGSVIRSTTENTVFFAIGLYDGANSDAFIAAEKFWEYADGTTQVDKDLYFPTGNVPGSTVKVAIMGLNQPSNASRFMQLSKFTASLDYGSIGSVQLGDSGSVGDPIGGPQDYTDGQVVVSTGRYISGTGNNTVGTGYIRLNANPKNSATPYMDIVERTGSGIYDVELKARLGDLSGVAGTRNVPEGFNGFGLMSEVAFLSGSNIKLEAPTFLLGDKNQNFVSGSNGNMEISSSNFHLNADGNVTMSGAITAEAGAVGGWNIDTTLSATNIVLNPTGPNIQLAGKTTFADNNVDGVYIGTEGIAIGDDNEFQVTNAGAVTATSATITGEINATSGNFSGNLTSTAIITGGTIRTADETTGTGKSVKIDGSNNVLEFHGDLVKYNSSATDIPGRLFVLDDSQILGGASSTGISNSGMPGMKFFGIDANTSTYDGATDAGTTNAKIYGGAYIPYTFGENYTEFNTMLTGHALGVYRGQLGQMKLSDGGDYGQETPYVYSLAGLTVNTTNASPSSPHNSRGNPTGHGGTSISGSGANAMMMSFQSNNIISRPNIGFHFSNTNTGISSTGINKPARAVSGGNNIRHPGSRGSGYNYFKNYEFTSIVVGNRAQDQNSAYNSRSRYYQWTDNEGGTKNFSLGTGQTDEYFRLEDEYTHAINPAFDGGSGHPEIDGVVRTPQNKSSTFWSNVRYIGYRIRIKTTTSSGAQVLVKITMRWGSDVNTQFFSDDLISGEDYTLTNFANYDEEFNYTAAPKWNDTAPAGSDAAPSPEAPRVYLRLQGNSNEAYTVQVDFTENGSNDSYLYAFGDGNENSRVEDSVLTGVDVTNSIEAKNSNIEGIKYHGYFGADHTGLFSRIRATTGTVYGVYSKTNDTGAVWSIHNEANTGADVYAGYFAGDLRATGHISYGTAGAISDERLKEDITLVSGSLEIINKLKPSRFKWKSDYKYEMDPSLSGTQDIGLIAQEVEDVLPELIFENSIPEKDFDLDLLNSQQGKYKGKKSSDFHKTFKFVKYDKLIPLLVEAIQEQQKQIEKLTEKIEELEEK